MKFSAITANIFQLDLKLWYEEELIPVKETHFLSRKSLTIPLLQGNLNKGTLCLEMCLFYLDGVKKCVEESKTELENIAKKNYNFVTKNASF